MTKTFLHKPNIGDILYALPVIRHRGGGTITLDSSLMPDYRDAFVCALSFLRRQPYLRLARDLNITLIGFLRGESMNIYAGAERVREG